MKFTAAVIMATAALTSATAINMDPAAQDAALKVDNLRMQFSHDYDCKWKKDGKLMTSVPACKGKNYKKHSYKFNKKDEESKKCFSAKDLDLTAHGQENWHSFSYCLPPRLEKKGCEFRMYDNVHCEGDAKMIINTKDTDEFSGECKNVDKATGKFKDVNFDDIKSFNQGGMRSVRIQCPVEDDECDIEDMKEADEE